MGSTSKVQVVAEMQMPHVVFMSIPATGHFNPTLPFVAELRRRGCEVTFYIPEQLRETVEAAGATWRPIPDSFAPDVKNLAVSKYVDTPTECNGYITYLAINEYIMPGLLEDLQNLERSPTVIVYDPHHCPWGRVASHVLGVPGVGFITVPGPGTVQIKKEQMEIWEASAVIDGPRRAIQELYGIDLLKNGRMLEFYSPEQNIVTTIEDIYAKPCDEMQIERFGHFPFTCVGALIDKKVKRVANVSLTSAPESLPVSEIEAGLRAGKQILYVSLGTVANSRFWDRKFGLVAESNGLAECTGKEITQHIFQTCFEAFGGDKNVLVIMAVGPQVDALEGLTSTPSNFILRKSVPQLEVLSLCHAFVTHGGANGVHEALSFGVPMAVVPFFGDQPTNADSVAAACAGVSFKDPLKSVKVSDLREAVNDLLDMSDSNTYRVAARRVMQKLADAGGASKAADKVLNLALSVSARLGGA